MVVTEDPCGDAGRGRGLQIVAIGAERVSGSGTMRSDEASSACPVCTKPGRTRARSEVSQADVTIHL
jgi:hypothetical protein